MARTINVDAEGKVGDQKVYKKKGEAVVDGQTYDVEHLATEGVPIIDPGVGEANILRRFYFKSTPEMKIHRPDKLTLINSFKGLIEITLWGDGFIIREDKPIEVLTKGKAKQLSKTMYREMVASGADFAILCVAVPRRGQTVLDTPMRAQ